jgi:hypothetical protein
MPLEASNEYISSLPTVRQRRQSNRKLPYMTLVRLVKSSALTLINGCPRCPANLLRAGSLRNPILPGLHGLEQAFTLRMPFGVQREFRPFRTSRLFVQIEGTQWGYHPTFEQRSGETRGVERCQNGALRKTETVNAVARGLSQAPRNVLCIRIPDEQLNLARNTVTGLLLPNPTHSISRTNLSRAAAMSVSY